MSVDKLTVGTDKKIVGEFTFSEALKSTDVTFKFTDGSRVDSKDINAAFGATFKTGDLGTYTVDADVLAGPNFDITGLVNYKNFLIGGSTKVTTSLLTDAGAAAGGVGVADFGALVGYQGADFTAAVQSKKLDAFNVSVLHKASDKLTVATLAGVSNSKPFSFKLGGSYKLDADTTVHGTADHEAKLSLVYKQKLNAFATLAVNTQVDAADLGSDKHKFGLTLSLSS